MSKAIYVCSKKKLNSIPEKLKLHSICSQLTPDFINNSCNHTLYTNNHISWAVWNDIEDNRKKIPHLFLGYTFEQIREEWTKTKTTTPDGNYAIFRSSSDCIEVLTDELATRTIWYYHHHDLFIASTSQRAIIMYLQSFEFNPLAMSWMLSSGTLGPEHSWDKRIKRLDISSTLTLNRDTWSIDIHQNCFQMSASENDTAIVSSVIEENITESIRHLEHLDYKKWVLPLSGGYDSRALLFFMKESIKLPSYFKTITWGISDSKDTPESDTVIAKRLASNVGVLNEFYPIDTSNEPLSLITEQFLCFGEGRNDHMNAYLDGMKLWEFLYEQKIKGIIRGDMAFGCPECKFDKFARFYNVLTTCDDFANLRKFQNDYELPAQKIPEKYRKQDGETTQQYMYRLHSIHKVPVLLAALADIKYSFLEQISPFLSKRILKAARTQHDSLRMNKQLFKNLVLKRSKGIPIATSGATEKMIEYLSRGEIKKEISQFLEQYGKDIVSPEMIHTVISQYNQTEIKRPFTQRLKNAFTKTLPKKLIKKLAIVKNKHADSYAKPNLDIELIAFRLYLTVKMKKLLKEDSSSIQME